MSCPHKSMVLNDRIPQCLGASATEDMAASSDFQELLKPFQQRASEAEDRLARLEAILATKTDAGIEELKKAEQFSEKEKVLKEVERLHAENDKLKYQILHLVRALKDADSKSASKVNQVDS
ncbi:hypothetical protein NMG60_11001098 [Bertholletia excelsa]